MAEFTTNQGNVLDLETKTVEAETNGEEYTVVVPPEGWVGINAIAELTGYMPQYVRTLVRKDKVEGVKIGRKGYEKWFLNPESAEEYRSRSHTRGGKRRFVFKIDLEDEDAVREALDEIGVDYHLELQYQPKDKDDSESESDEAPAVEVEPEANEPDAGEETLDFLNQ